MMIPLLVHHSPEAICKGGWVVGRLKFKKNVPVVYKSSRYVVTKSFTNFGKYYVYYNVESGELRAVTKFESCGREK